MSDAKRKPPMDAAESETLRMLETLCTGTGRPWKLPRRKTRDGPERHYCRTADMHVSGSRTSHSTEEAGEQSRPEGGGGTRGGKGIDQGNAERTLLVPDTGPGKRGMGLRGVREAAKRDKKLRFTALLHHITAEMLQDSYFELKRMAAPGVDGVTWHAYGHDLEERIDDLHERVHRGAYRAQPSKRAWIPKADGRQRPLGIAALEDKIVQQAVKTVLEQIYEEDFLGFSYGFGPGEAVTTR